MKTQTIIRIQELGNASGLTLGCPGSAIECGGRARENIFTGKDDFLDKKKPRK